MGSAHDAFVPAAILLDNPGITLEEFDLRLRSVGPFYEPYSFGFGSGYLFSDEKSYRRGLLQTAQILRMSPNTDYVNPSVEDPLQISRLTITERPGKDKWLEPSYHVNQYLGNRYGEKETVRATRLGKYKVGDNIFWIGARGSYFYVNDKLEMDTRQRFKTNPFRVDKIYDETKEVHGKNLAEVVTTEMRRIIPSYSTEEFLSLKDLIKKYPEFAPDKLFDLTPTSGKLYVGSPFGINLKWFKKSDKYYLDLDNLVKREQSTTYPRILSNVNPDFIYTSIVLTAEAIKHKEWEMLEYASGDERPGILAEFLTKHPDSKRRHDNQLIQFWDSKNAIASGLTHSEWLALRGVEQWRRGLTDEQAKKEFQLICNEAPEQIKRMKQRREYEARPMRPPVKEKFPF